MLRIIFNLLPVSLKLLVFQYKSLFSKASLSNRNATILPNNRRTIIFLPTMGWSDFIQRPQHLAKAFANNGWTVIYMIKDQVVDKVMGVEKISENIFLCSNVRLLTGIPIPWIYNPWTINSFYFSYFKECNVIYDYLDKLEVHHYFSPKSFKQHKKLVLTSKIVIASSDNLLKDVIDDRDDSLLIPNAVNSEDFIFGRNDFIPDDLFDIVKTQRPIIGYYGAFAKWIDYDLILFLADKIPEFEFVFLGVDCDNSRMGYQWSNIKNISFLGWKPYGMLPHYAKYFDVAIIPFKVNDVTNSVSPVKLFEYMAMQLPVVSTNISECRKYSTVLVAEDYESFANDVVRAVGLKINLDYQKELSSIVKTNTWDYRCKQLIERMDSFNSRN